MADFLFAFHGFSLHEDRPSRVFTVLPPTLSCFSPGVGYCIVFPNMVK
ncbi:unnamed protein product, partial [Ectocarpus sp. 13 AM-2016]